MNSVKTVVLLGLLSGLLLFLGEVFGGRNGLVMGLALAVGMNFFSYFFSDKIVLMTYSAQPLTAEQNPEIYARMYPLIQRLAERMQIPMPKLWVIPDASPNAFATGRDPQHASVAFTAGILGLMNDREIEGVIAHELGHVLHRDILISSVAATLAAAIGFVARMGFFFGGQRSEREERGGGFGGLVALIVAPIAAMVIQLAISRSREFSADETSAKYTGSPDGLISALGKLERGVERIPMQDAEPATAHLFIMNPFRRGMFSGMFSTHPSTQQRIERLQAMRHSPGLSL
jgi:heat shock protein HtpX